MEILSASEDSLTNEDDIELEFVEFSKKFFTKHHAKPPHPPNVDWNPISTPQQEAFEAPFTEEEITKLSWVWAQQIPDKTVSDYQLVSPHAFTRSLLGCYQKD